MAFDTKILVDKVKKLKEVVIKGDFSDALIASLNTGNALMQNRIFGDNVDVKGQTFGGYVGVRRKSPRLVARLLRITTSRTDRVRIKRNAPLSLTYYQRKRVNKGRQIVRKDLELYGSLRRAIEVEIINERSAVVQFNDYHSAEIARGQENQITNLRNGQPGYTQGNGEKIFAFNENERDKSNEQVKLLISKIIKSELH